MDPIKEAFSKIKDDMNVLRKEISSLKEVIDQTRNQTNALFEEVYKLQQTNQQTHNPTHKETVQPLYSQNMPISIGNKGVPTDKQTNIQTNQQTQNKANLGVNPAIEEFRRANLILDELDEVKKEIRNTFNGLTSQEMAVFEALYTLEEQNYDNITYKSLANLLNLSESSIRDYINKLISKKIPINKNKINNKQVNLSISEDLKSVTNLSTINELRAL